ncbi:MAG: hypothetical protein NDJ75_01580 [Thermoanaerobaculia bacterium]|nr:hypothetical protein [Thermoanaerobaculia bacterium]
MIPLVSLWLPIVASAGLVFLVSSVLHMALKYHQADYKQLPDEARQIDALRGLAPGYYNFPYCTSMKEAGTPESLEKFRRGPVGMLAVLPNGAPAIGKFLALWFVYSLLVSLFAGYLASFTLSAGAHYLAVFRVTGTAAFLAYGLANMVDSIWKGVPWSNTVRATVDGLLYALVTAGAFGWLWPR